MSKPKTQMAGNGIGALHSRIYTAAKKRLNGFQAVFSPWNARPDRDRAWHERERAEMRRSS